MAGTFQPFSEFPPFDWSYAKELIADQDPGGSDVFSNKSADATLVYSVRADTAPYTGDIGPVIRGAVPFFLGYSWCDAGSPYKLHRIPPAPHPIYGYQLRANAVNIELRAPHGNTANASFSPYRDSAIITDGTYIRRYASYTEAKITVRYGLRPEYLYPDSSTEWQSLGAYEYDRYCTRYKIEPSLTTLQAETANSMYFISGTANNPNGKPFQGTTFERITKTRYVLTWHEVPHNFVFDASDIPVKIQNCTGRVNNATFLGFPAGTLLMEAPTYEKNLFPWYSEDGRAFHYDITIPFEWFDPTPATDYYPVTTRGHNLFPWRMGGGTNGGPGWYDARRGLTAATTDASSPRFIETVDMTQIFTHVLAP